MQLSISQEVYFYLYLTYAFVLNIVLPLESPSLARKIICDQAFLSFGETPYTFTSWVVFRPLIKVSTNIGLLCQILLDMHSSRFQQRWLLSKCVSLLSRQEVNFKLIQQSLAKTSQILKIKSAVLLLQISHYHCCVVT